jgi:clan AA aspartic protease
MIRCEYSLPFKKGGTMTTSGEDDVGRFSIEIQIANRRDVIKAEEGTLAQKDVRRITVRGLVDSGAGRLVLPNSVVQKLGLPSGDKTKVRYADGRTRTRDTAQDVQVEIGERKGTFTAIVEPSRTEALIGAIVLEDLDYLVDCLNQRLVPRDPRYVISEIESVK